MVKCPYCKQSANKVPGNVIYPHRPDLAEKQFWLCTPCDAYVGIDELSGRPLGRLADAPLRAAKRQAHEAFDPLWRFGQVPRRKAYLILAWLLQMDPARTHIGLMNIKECMKVVELCSGRDPLNLDDYQIALTWARGAYPLRKRKSKK